MERLLDAIASRLQIRVICEEDKSSALDSIITVTMHLYDYKEVPEDVSELFKKELKNHLVSRLQEIDVGESIEYVFDYGQVRPIGEIMDDANDNMAEVLQTLPSLPERERYVLPVDTYICFTLTQKKEDEYNFVPEVSNWIREEYFKQ